MSSVQAVDAKVTALEGRLEAVENSLGGAVASGSNDDLIAFQKQLLVSLRGVRLALKEEEAARAATQSTAVSNEALVEENTALKKQIAKLNYRIEHLLRHIPPPQ
ncbi:hypothetical protein H310_07338 [Aphanomyces invadans]|uniref:Uncharacterized protein n=1 Tax=Aphanomyces invadans TaxID=157072 RepID=A0A024U3J9_9STRA|nr:hypothetical protein H310_07338 [Aphanomyces invadans]ETW00805.1 hypothetical protein H310_07338 [Aphanomyces invadans]|eukprot:XP_008870940.1 hypothetical protein H310_07338 [Aphanomyces invadans]